MWHLVFNGLISEPYYKRSLQVAFVAVSWGSLSLAARSAECFLKAISAAAEEM